MFLLFELPGLDGTLILTKSGHVFPKDNSDWHFFHETVVPKLREMDEKEEMEIVVFTGVDTLEVWCVVLDQV